MAGILQIRWTTPRYGAILSQMVKEKRFKTGDLVQLKSGGPIMTVTSVDVVTDVSTSWFAGKKLERGTFPYDALSPADEAEPER